eukprot:TRINITY_DN37603_c0_g1_i1.p1 TRINITY_DN37603_c0_g1~~TRINITY_DN37603_c0_g1_i1.p1  ORF type:complete len:787 (+),score=89.13 TRINITY_DN37603_c0_g1_i1:80-2440(+)
MPRGLIPEAFVNHSELVVWNTALSSEYKHDGCAICHEAFSTEVPEICRVLDCLHVFHAKCVDLWFIKATFCPLCKHDLKTQRNALPTRAATQSPEPAVGFQGASASQRPLGSPRPRLTRTLRMHTSSQRSLGGQSHTSSYRSLGSRSHASSLRSGQILVGHSNSDPVLLRVLQAQEAERAAAEATSIELRPEGEEHFEEGEEHSEVLHSSRSERSVGLLSASSSGAALPAVHEVSEEASVSVSTPMPPLATTPPQPKASGLEVLSVDDAGHVARSAPPSPCSSRDAARATAEPFSEDDDDLQNDRTKLVSTVPVQPSPHPLCQRPPPLPLAQAQHPLQQGSQVPTALVVDCPERSADVAAFQHQQQRQLVPLPENGVCVFGEGQGRSSTSRSCLPSEPVARLATTPRQVAVPISRRRSPFVVAPAGTGIASLAVPAASSCTEVPGPPRGAASLAAPAPPGTDISGVARGVAPAETPPPRLVDRGEIRSNSLPPSQAMTPQRPPPGSMRSATPDGSVGCGGCGSSLASSRANAPMQRRLADPATAVAAPSGAFGPTRQCGSGGCASARLSSFSGASSSAGAISPRATGTTNVAWPTATATPRLRRCAGFSASPAPVVAVVSSCESRRRADLGAACASTSSSSSGVAINIDIPSISPLPPLPPPSPPSAFMSALAIPRRDGGDCIAGPCRMGLGSSGKLQPYSARQHAQHVSYSSYISHSGALTERGSPPSLATSSAMPSSPYVVPTLTRPCLSGRGTPGASRGVHGSFSNYSCASMCGPGATSASGS